jgi:hypothetical protein
LLLQQAAGPVGPGLLARLLLQLLLELQRFQCLLLLLQVLLLRVLGELRRFLLGHTADRRHHRHQGCMVLHQQYQTQGRPSQVLLLLAALQLPAAALSALL